MTLREVLKAVVAYRLPDEMDWYSDQSTDFRPQETSRVRIRTMSEDETATETYPGDPLLMPWYDAEVYGLDPDDGGMLDIWIRYDEYIREKMPIWRGVSAPMEEP